MYAAGARVCACARWPACGGVQPACARFGLVPSAQAHPTRPSANLSPAQAQQHTPLRRARAAARCAAGAHAAKADATPRELWLFAALEAPRSGAVPGTLGAARAGGMEPPVASSERRSPGSFPATEARRTPQSELVLLAEAPPSWLCSICRDAVPHEPVVTPCGHSFCRTCLTKALGATSGGAGSAVRSRCPMCRALVPSANAVRPNERARPAHAPEASRGLALCVTRRG